MTRNARQKRLPRRLLYDYDEVADMLGYKPSYIKWLCDTKRLGYVVKEWRYGVYKRRCRFIPYAEVMRWFLERCQYTRPLRW